MENVHPRVLIIHHNDRDGIVSAAIVANHILDMYDINTEIVYSEQNYTKPLHELFPINKIKDSYTGVYIVDYSISTYEDAEWITDLSKVINVIWIDHHSTSIETETKNIGKFCDLDMKSIPGIRIDGIAASALCWLYFNGHIKMLMHMKAMHKNKITPKYARELLIEFRCPKLILYTHRYDIWDHNNKDMDPLYFNYGNMHDLNWWINIISNANNSDNIATEEILNGKEKFNSIVKLNNKYCEDYGFETELFVGNKIYTVFAVNKAGGNSILFGDRINKYDLVSVFQYIGPEDCYRYSIYSAESSKINVAEIAKIFGGGGHPHAAGFSSKEFLYRR